jgi:hypothetical protein
MLALPGAGKLFSIFFKKIQKNPKVPAGAAVTSFMMSVKARKAPLGLHECSQK